MDKWARKKNTPRFGLVWCVRVRNGKSYYSEDGKIWWTSSEETGRVIEFPPFNIRHPDTEEYLYRYKG